jgi:hypothetical protein
VYKNIRILIVRDLLDVVHNVTLIKCIFVSGKPRGAGFWVRGAHGCWENKEGSVYEQQGEEVDGS